jgi:hypothetical protein
MHTISSVSVTVLRVDRPQCMFVRSTLLAYAHTKHLTGPGEGTNRLICHGYIWKEARQECKKLKACSCFSERQIAWYFWAGRENMCSKCDKLPRKDEAERARNCPSIHTTVTKAVL